MRWVVIAAAILALAGCEATAEVYPANKLAQQIGVPQIAFTRQGTGGGPITAIMPDGEKLAGRYRVVSNAVIGSAFTSGAGGPASATAIGVGQSAALASMRGPKTVMNCHLAVDIGGHGGGKCATLEGAEYQVMF